MRQSPKNSVVTRLKDRLPYFLLFLIILVILAINIKIRRNYFDDSDGYGLYEIAIILQRGDLGDNYQVQKWPPGYPVLLIFVNYFTQDYFLAAKIIAMTAGALYTVTTALMVKQITKNDKIALFVGLNAGLSISIWGSLTFATDLPFSSLFQLCFYFLLKGFEGYYQHYNPMEFDFKKGELKLYIKRIFTTPYRYFIYAGLCGGLSCTIRWTGMQILPISIFLFLLIPFYLPLSFKKKLKASLFILIKQPFLIFLCTFMLFWSFWLIPNWILFGTPFHNVIWKEPLRWGPVYISETDLKPEDFDSLFDIILYDPLLFIRNWLTSFGQTLNFFYYQIFIGETLFFDLGTIPSILIFLFILCITVYGFISAITTPNKNNLNESQKELELKEIPEYYKQKLNFIQVSSLLIIIFIFLLLVSVSHFVRRFTFPVLPFGFFFFLLGLKSLWMRLWKKYIMKKNSQNETIIANIKKKKIIIDCILLFLIGMGSFYGGMFHVNRTCPPDEPDSIELVLAANYLKKHTNSTNIAFPRENHWYYYNQSVVETDLNFTFPRSVEELVVLPADYIVYAQGWPTLRIPEMKFLLNASDPRIPSNYNLVYYYDKTPNKIIVIYQIQH